jgi:hypothetical protein
MRLLVRKAQSQRVFDALIRVWAVASVALLVVMVVMRVVNGPVHDDAWWTASVVVWTAPLWLMLLNLVLGWLWFGLFLLTYPFPPLRRSLSRFMEHIDTQHVEEPPE